MRTPLRCVLRLLAGALVAIVINMSTHLHASAIPTQPIGSVGSSWAANALDEWTKTAASRGMQVTFSGNGSSEGRKKFAERLAPFTVSELPFRGATADPDDLKYNTVPKHGMAPAVAGGTALAYNLRVGGQQIRDLRLDQETIAKIFTGQIKNWDHEMIKATNPGMTLPSSRITVIFRSDGSGATAQFLLWLMKRFPADYKQLCRAGGCDPSHTTSFFPKNIDGFVGAPGSLGVTQAVVDSENTINYDEYSYALQRNLPVIKVKNQAGFFVEPASGNVAVGLTQAKINLDKGSEDYLSQNLDGVYGYEDPRTYVLSTYTYWILPFENTQALDNAKGASLSYFVNMALCEGQKPMEDLGYSPLPMNLVLAAQDQVLNIPGLDAATKQAIEQNRSLVGSAAGNPCNNPTFKPGDNPALNQLTRTAAFPPNTATAKCDKACKKRWTGIDWPDDPIDHNPTGGTGPTGGQARGSAGQGADQIYQGSAADEAGNDDCDPATEDCSKRAKAKAASRASAGPLQQTKLASDQGWGSQQNLMLLSALIIAALIAGPPIAASAFNNAKKSPSTNVGGSYHGSSN